jgi:type I restriction enzyme R subunit
MPHAYTEDQLVEQPAIGLFAELGWDVALPHPHPGPLPGGEGVVRLGRSVSIGSDPRDAGLFGRETKGEVVLVTRLRTALERLNPELPSEAITAAMDKLTRDRSAMLLEQANREVYQLLKEGVPVSVPDLQQGGQRKERVRVIDWSRDGGMANNDFLLVSQFSVTGALYTCRPDLVGFVNGLPLVVIELKKPGVPARAAFDENLTHYKAEIPQLFWFNALLIASNGTDSRVGSLTADWERWAEWKRIEREDEPRRVSLEVMIRGTCDKGRLLDLVENFTLFSEHKAGLAKILGQNHQVLGVNNAIASMLEARARGHGRGGVFWQTQGSGKSFSMVFFAQKVLRTVPGNWTFVVVTDRVELDDQIAKTFKAAGVVSEAEGDDCHATSGDHLRKLLRGNHRYVFTLIHKFQPERSRRGDEAEAPLLTSGATERMPVLCDRPDVIVLTDEAHRSQYDTLALNMRAALPKALFLAFTGTPLIAGEERTKEVFGDYVSIYDFQQSVEDGATVPLFYENRTPELQLTNPDLNEDIYDLIEAAELDPEQEARLERELSRQYHILTRDDRLDTVAQDIVRHFLGRGFVGKAMVVSIDKATALKMHDKVRKHWAAELQRVEQEVARRSNYARNLGGGPSPELVARLEVLRTTDMALIVSPAQNEVEQMRRLGLDIVPHRLRMNTSDPALDERFKDTVDPLRIVFVCAMWLTGFDAPSCSTVYLDKPMRNHTLMQTIARANRVFPGKHSGLIVDYANVFVSLEKALALYGVGQGGQNPVRDKGQLVEELRRAVKAASAYCSGHGVSLEGFEATAAGSMVRLDLLDKAREALISPDAARQEFLGHERLVKTLFQAVKPDTAAIEFAPRVASIGVIADAIRAQLHPDPVDISEVLGDIGKLLDASISGVEMADRPGGVMDLSRIDFEALSRRFRESKR